MPQGRQAWRLLRTDRDGAAAGELPQMAAAFAHFVLSEAERGGKHQLLATGKNEWRFGQVRPFKVLSVGRELTALPPGGDVLADRQKSLPSTVPTVAGEHPWYVIVEFWWRAPSKTIDFPALKVSMFGTRHYELDGADWVLDRAVSLPDESDPGDQTWEDEMGEKAKDAADTGLDALLKGSMGLLILAGLYLLSRK